MALVNRKVICEAITPLIQIKRFRGKINIQKPKPPHFEKAKYLALAKPWFLPRIDKSIDVCTKFKPSKHQTEEENPFQNIIAQELKKWLKTSRLVAFCHINPITTDQQFNAFVTFKKEKMHFKQYGKKTMEIAVKGTPYETVLNFYISHNVTIFSPEPEIKKLLKILKKFPQLILLAGIYDNKLVSKDELLHYSTIPSLEAAQVGLVHTLESVGSQLVQNLNSHQSTLVSHLEERAKQLQELD